MLGAHRVWRTNSTLLPGSMSSHKAMSVHDIKIEQNKHDDGGSHSTHISAASDSPLRFLFRARGKGYTPFGAISASVGKPSSPGVASSLSARALALPDACGRRPARSASLRDRSRTCSRSVSRLFIVLRRLGGALLALLAAPAVLAGGGEVEWDVREEWMDFDFL